ncbi:MAG: hypothetical protein ACXV6K_08905 [Halobacteriota archaeon]
MLTVDLFTKELLPIHKSTISVHHAKRGYDYPAIRLPHTLSKLAGLSTRIYQTVHDGALAFLVVVAPQTNPSKQLENADACSEFSAFTRRGPRVRISPSPLITGTFFDSEAKIVSDDEEEELATSEELPTSADDNEERKEEQANEYTVDLGYGYVNYYRGLDGKLRSVSTSQKNL